MRYRKFRRYNSHRTKRVPCASRLTPAQVKAGLLRLRAARDRLRQLRVDLPNQHLLFEARRSTVNAKIARAEAEIRAVVNDPESYQRKWGGLSRSMTAEAQRKIWALELEVSEIRNSKDNRCVHEIEGRCTVTFAEAVRWTEEKLSILEPQLARYEIVHARHVREAAARQAEPVPLVARVSCRLACARARLVCASTGCSSG
jgi:hypothetical protein